MYFYELHEGDDDLYSDLLLARETEMEPDVFFDIVQTVRRRVQDSFEHDTLIEAIAEELERDFGFIAITDDRLHAAVNVSHNDADNFLADLDASDDEDDEDDADDADDSDADEDEDDDEDGDDDEDADEEDDGALANGEFRSLYVDIDRGRDGRPN